MLSVTKAVNLFAPQRSEPIHVNFTTLSPCHHCPRTRHRGGARARFGGAHAAVPADPRADPVVRDLTERATQAHIALMCGDVARYRTFITQTDDFTLVSPFGGEPTRGTAYTTERWASIGRFFRNGSESSLDSSRPTGRGTWWC